MVCLGPLLPHVSLHISMNSVKGDKSMADSVKEILNDTVDKRIKSCFKMISAI